MCFESLLPIAIGTGLSALGSTINNNENNANAQAIADARNKVLATQTNKNNVIANDARGTFNTRMGQVQPSALGQEQQDVTGQRAGSINSNLPTITPTTFPGAADSSTAVKSAVAKAVTDALATAQQKATAQASLGGFGDLFQKMGLQDADASRNIATDVGFVQSNNALTPQLQDFAQQDATKPNSGLGGLISGIGNAFGSYAGAHA